MTWAHSLHTAEGLALPPPPLLTHLSHIYHSHVCTTPKMPPPATIYISHVKPSQEMKMKNLRFTV